MNLQQNLSDFIGTRIKPDDRDASFDYCFNYFQSFREREDTGALIKDENVELSCLHLGFYLASWGMYRGSAHLLQKSSRYLIPCLSLIAAAPLDVWSIDVNTYDEAHIDALCIMFDGLRETFSDSEHPATDTLVSKIMLGVFGSVPAFDMYFRKACVREGIPSTLGRRSLQALAGFYSENAMAIDSFTHHTLCFDNGEPTQRRYTRAKVIDMAFYREGEGLTGS